VEKESHCGPRQRHFPAQVQSAKPASLSRDHGTLEGGVLPFETRYQIAIAVSEINGCAYCLSAFTATGKGNGMKDETLAMCRTAGSSDPKIDAVLKFAAAIVRERGAVTAEDFQKVKSAGCSDEEIFDRGKRRFIYLRQLHKPGNRNGN